VSRRARRVYRRLTDGAVGLCEIDATGRVEHMDGGAVAAVGSNATDWLGQLLPEPFRTKGWAVAMRGESAMVVSPEPVHEQRWAHALYEPRFDGAGQIDGCVVWWLLEPSKKEPTP